MGASERMEMLIITAEDVYLVHRDRCVRLTVHFGRLETSIKIRETPQTYYECSKEQEEGNDG